MNKILIVENLTKKYNGVTIIDNISFHVYEGQIIAITGTSGVGKSTLLNVISSLDRPDDGKVLINNTDILTLDGNQLADFRNTQIGFVFQSYNLLQELTVYENICLPAMINKQREKDIKQRILKLVDKLNLPSSIINKYPYEISGGEQQRISIIRALINNPKIVFADEPSGCLDNENSLQLHKLFYNLSRDIQQTFIIVTHDEQLANLSDKKYKLVDKKLK